ncbi:flagellar protein FliT [Brevibacillus centrosporus]|uniref:flagellar protein FliT n=1 Tax=Brevibacillus centrosporus TaxID=54910 RepID=UPI003985F735
MNRMDELADELLQLTLQIQEQLLTEDSDPNEWLNFLDKRDIVMSQIDQLMAEGLTLSDSQKQVLQNGYQLNQKILPLMDARLQKLQGKMAVLQKSKMAVSTYNDVDTGPNGYGAFFDRRK